MEVIFKSQKKRQHINPTSKFDICSGKEARQLRSARIRSALAGHKPLDPNRSENVW